MPAIVMVRRSCFPEASARRDCKLGDAGEDQSKSLGNLYRQKGPTGKPISEPARRDESATVSSRVMPEKPLHA